MLGLFARTKHIRIAIQYSVLSHRTCSGMCVCVCVCRSFTNIICRFFFVCYFFRIGYSQCVFHSLFATAPKHAGWHWRSDLVSYENRMHPVFSIRRGKNATATKKTTNRLDSHTSNILKVPHGKRTMNTRIRVSSNGN